MDIFAVRFNVSVKLNIVLRVRDTEKRPGHSSLGQAGVLNNKMGICDADRMRGRSSR